MSLKDFTLQEITAESAAQAAIAPAETPDVLDLQVLHQQVGSITTNAHEVAAVVAEILKAYEGDYSGDIAAAKKDRARLNKASKVLQQKRLEIERAFAAPLAEFKATMASTEKAIKAASERIDAVIKADDARWQQERHTNLTMYWATLDGAAHRPSIEDYLKANPALYYRTTNEKSWRATLDKYSADIVSDVAQLSAHSDPDVAREAVARYCEGMSAAMALSQAHTSVERIRAAAKAQQEAEERAKAQAAAAAAKQEQGAQPQPAAKPVVAPQPAASVPQQPHQPDAEDLLERRFVVRGTREQIIALSDFLNDNNIYFDRID